MKPFLRRDYTIQRVNPFILSFPELRRRILKTGRSCIRGCPAVSVVDSKDLVRMLIYKASVSWLLYLATSSVASIK